MNCVGWLHYGCIAILATFSVVVGGIERVFNAGVVSALGEMYLFLFGAALVFPRLIEVSFNHGYGRWWILLQRMFGEAGKVGKKTCVQGLLQCGQGW